MSRSHEYKLGMVAGTRNPSLLEVVGTGRHLQLPGRKSVPRFSEMQRLRGVREKAIEQGTLSPALASALIHRCPFTYFNTHSYIHTKSLTYLFLMCALLHEGG